MPDISHYQQLLCWRLQYGNFLFVKNGNQIRVINSKLHLIFYQFRWRGCVEETPRSGFAFCNLMEHCSQGAVILLQPSLKYFNFGGSSAIFLVASWTHLPQELNQENIIQFNYLGFSLVDSFFLEMWVKCEHWQTDAIERAFAYSFYAERIVITLRDRCFQVSGSDVGHKFSRLRTSRTHLFIFVICTIVLRQIFGIGNIRSIGRRIVAATRFRSLDFEYQAKLRQNRSRGTSILDFVLIAHAGIVDAIYPSTVIDMRVRGMFPIVGRSKFFAQHIFAVIKSSNYQRLLHRSAFWITTAKFQPFPLLFLLRKIQIVRLIKRDVFLCFLTIGKSLGHIYLHIKKTIIYCLGKELILFVITSRWTDIATQSSVRYSTSKQLSNRKNHFRFTILLELWRGYKNLSLCGNPFLASSQKMGSPFKLCWKVGPC